MYLINGDDSRPIIIPIRLYCVPLHVRSWAFSPLINAAVIEKVGQPGTFKRVDWLGCYGLGYEKERFESGSFLASLGKGK
jgi:hypothetical protein